ncbi:ArpU family phage packaging/lysis transcriptional regulator [Sporolactobacillus pectinivorans]|uniref:ArpU family phage packaging/lysis transcriptional regulator n=1 Tax=Sporolactobacillus pectinivorans TaxID=1591408 RepID=UPI000C25F88A|nr:ArpU family phage packaging/lysis transcriptional regulator [Sporolactobacillus pectinivorans]
MEEMDKKKVENSISIVKNSLLNCRYIFVKITKTPFVITGDQIKLRNDWLEKIEDIERKTLIDISHTVNSLDVEQKKIIFYKYLSFQSMYDFEIQNSLALSQRTYYRKKRSALIKLALALGFLQVMITV